VATYRNDKKMTQIEYNLTLRI